MNDEDELNHILIATHSLPLTRSDSPYKVPSSHSIHPLLPGRKWVLCLKFHWNVHKLCSFACFSLLVFFCTVSSFSPSSPFLYGSKDDKLPQRWSIRPSLWTHTVRSLHWKSHSELVLLLYEKLKRIRWWIFITSTQYLSHFFSHNFHVLLLEKDWRLKFEQARNFPTSFCFSSCLTCSFFFFYLCSCNDFYDTFFELFIEWQAQVKAKKNWKWIFYLLCFERKESALLVFLKLKTTRMQRAPKQVASAIKCHKKTFLT